MYGVIDDDGHVFTSVSAITKIKNGIRSVGRMSLPAEMQVSAKMTSGSL